MNIMRLENLRRVIIEAAKSEKACKRLGGHWVSLPSGTHLCVAKGEVVIPKSLKKLSRGSEGEPADKKSKKASSAKRSGGRRRRGGNSDIIGDIVNIAQDVTSK